MAKLATIVKYKFNTALVIFPLKALVTTACLWWLAGYVDYEQLRSALAGIDTAVVLALSLAYLLVLWSCTLPGAFMLLRESNPRDATGRQESSGHSLCGQNRGL